MNTQRRVVVALGLALTGLLSSCGPTSVAGVGGEGTGIFAAGPVEGFGSVVVAGQRYDDSEARVVLEIDPRQPQPQPLAALKLGTVVQLQANADGRAQTIVVAPELTGPVQAIDLAGRRFTVASQTVQVDAVAGDPTLFEGLSALADLLPGTPVIVHGRRDAAGVLRATRLVRLPATVGVRVTGTLERLGATAAVVQGLAVDLRGTALPAGSSALQVGERVVVFARALAANGSLAAEVIARAPQAPGDAASVRLSGVAVRLQAGARFTLLGVEVDASGLPTTALQGLAEGRLVDVDGRPVGGVLRAENLRLRDDAQPPSVSIRATVGDFVDARRFSVRGTPVLAADARFEGLTPGNLANGVPVEVTATVRSTGVVVTRVQGTRPADGAPYVQAGAVTDWDAAQRRFRLFGLAPDFRLANDVQLVGGSLAQLQSGSVVEVRGTLSGSDFTVRTLSFAAADAALELAGIAATVEVTGSDGFLQVNEVDIVWNATTVFLGPTRTSADLADGRAVRIRAVRESGNVLRALEIDARETQPGVFRLRGTVSRYVSVADFSIDGQRVDASGAVFTPPGLAGALAGGYVDVEGALVGAVLRATSVSDP